jgi:phage baseplate assembly protein W
MIGFSPKYPLRFDTELGAYSATKTLKEVAKQNFINLMLTAQGERIMDNKFGAGLRRHLFEQNTQFLHTQIASTIRQQTATYLPFIEIRAVRFNSHGLSKDYGDQILDISIEFAVPSIASADTLTISSGTGL